MDPFATATEMLTVLRARKASAIELLELHRTRIARHNPELNAIVEPDFDRARQAAEAADRRRVAGEDAPLLGLSSARRRPFGKSCMPIREIRMSASTEGSRAPQEIA